MWFATSGSLGISVLELSVGIFKSDDGSGTRSSPGFIYSSIQPTSDNNVKVCRITICIRDEFIDPVQSLLSVGTLINHNISMRESIKISRRTFSSRSSDG